MNMVIKVLNFHQVPNIKKDAEHDLRDLEGLYKDFSDPDSGENFELREKESGDPTFHFDGSNRDESDDDMIFDKNIDTWMMKCKIVTQTRAISLYIMTVMKKKW